MRKQIDPVAALKIDKEKIIYLHWYKADISTFFFSWRWDEKIM